MLLRLLLKALFQTAENNNLAQSTKTHHSQKWNKNQAIQNIKMNIPQYDIQVHC